jgi:hypothetical protein
MQNVVGWPGSAGMGLKQFKQLDVHGEHGDSILHHGHRGQDRPRVLLTQDSVRNRQSDSFKSQPDITINGHTRIE